MRILYISPRFPYPPDQGDKAVIYNHLKFLSMENEITLLSLFQNEDELTGVERLKGYCRGVEVFKKRPNLSAANLFYAVCRDDPFTVIRYYSPRMLKRSRLLIESGAFDVVHSAFYYMGQYVMNKRIVIPPNTVSILDTHNCEYLVYSRYARLVKNPLVKLPVLLEAMRIKGYEPAMHRRFDALVAFSELDKKNMRGLSGARNIFVNPACIEPVVIKDGGPSDPEEKNTLLFFGLLSTPANDDAVRFFYRDIFPLIRNGVRGVKFLIAGKSAGRFISGLARDPSVKLLGLVPDLGQVLRRASLVIAPLRIGGGIRVKILESWAAGKAVVSTSVGAEGIEAGDGKDIVIADSPAAFAAAVIRLLEDDNCRKKIGKAALAKVLEYYNPARVMSNLERIYKETKEAKLRAKND
ncbi:MAG: glycosyltransferase [Candidatus Omnitrophica bacterium]|nr:glycosyltransferase [Candidatus Omnitrophota bacterium]